MRIASTDGLDMEPSADEVDATKDASDTGRGIDAFS